MSSITEVRDFVRFLGGTPASTSKLTVAGVSASVQVGAYKYVRIVATADMNVAFGDASVAATASDMLVPANSPEIFYTGKNTHVAVIGTGDAYLTVLDAVLPEPINVVGNYGGPSV